VVVNGPDALMCLYKSRTENPAGRRGVQVLISAQFFAVQISERSDCGAWSDTDPIFVGRRRTAPCTPTFADRTHLRLQLCSTRAVG